MTNIQVRLLAAGIALLAGAHAASTDNLDVNVGLAIILVSSVQVLNGDEELSLLPLPEFLYLGTNRRLTSS